MIRPCTATWVLDSLHGNHTFGEGQRPFMSILGCGMSSSPKPSLPGAGVYLKSPKLDRLSDGGKAPTLFKVDGALNPL